MQRDNPMQSLVDSLNEATKIQRAEYHLTLGELIEFLDMVEEKQLPVVFDHGGSPVDPHSYRGHYSDLSYETGEERMVAEVLSEARDLHGDTLTGYKGGQFEMEDQTPIWNADWGTSIGPPVLDIAHADDCIVLETGDE